MGVDPLLKAFEDKVPILQVFIHRVRIGKLAAKGDKIKSWSVEDYLRAVAQTFLAVGSNDPRLNASLKTHFRIGRMLAAWKKEDPPAHKVKPVPVSVIRHIAKVAAHLSPGNEKLRAAADMIITAFFLLLCPGEYTDSVSDATSFTLGTSSCLWERHGWTSLMHRTLSFTSRTRSCSHSRNRKMESRTKSCAWASAVYKKQEWEATHLIGER